jgi:hypothetical protein
MRLGFDINTTRQAKHGFLCAAILGVVLPITQASTIEWHFLGTGTQSPPPPNSLVISPAAPTTADTISFVAPTEGLVSLNGQAAADQYGNPALSVDLFHRIVGVTFSAPLDEPIPDIVLPVSGVDGKFGPLEGPLAPGTWTFVIQTNSYTFTVAAATPSPPTATVEWHFLGSPPNATPPPTSLVISPANPNAAESINFIAPADGEGGINAIAASDQYGIPLISVDSTNQTVTVTFSSPLDDPIPDIVVPVSGVDGQIGPLNAGTWVLKILTNSYSFNVAGLPLGIAPVGDQVVISWPALGSNYILQATSDLSTGNWSTITSGITTNGTGYVFTNTVSSQAGYFRLKQE